MGLRRGTDHHWSGPRLPTGRETRPLLECFRCAAVGDPDPKRADAIDGRKLVPIRVVRGADATTLGAALLCAPCIAELVPLDPDPLTVPEVA